MLIFTKHVLIYNFSFFHIYHNYGHIYGHIYGQILLYYQIKIKYFS